ncbi:MAG: hypothetical protein LBR07_09935, partial [Puniceicoccales bacterium]|nr:hypothetical protein [Puniceicoccales bacterium]
MSLDVDSLFAGSAGTDNSPKTPSENISLAFDIGHSSIGWAVFGGAGGYHLNGCGTVVFAESCQNQKRAQFRRTRRHIVATKSRIRRLREVLLARGVLTADELDALGNSHPWLDAADVLRGKRLLSWRELWNVLRWYAHNRGYDGNSRWARSEDAAGAGADHSDEQEADTEKVKKAHGLLRQFGTDSMAETITEALAVDHNTAKQNGGRVKKSSRVYFKGFGAAFPREIVVDEVRRILEAHKFDAAANAGTGSGLRGLDDAFITGVVGSPKITGGEKEDWKIALPADWSDAQRKKFLGTRSARTYEGGLLFGQFVPRFDNRIIPACRITGKNTPSKHSAAFYRFRWMQTLGNVRVRDKIATAGAGAKEEYCKEPRPLTPAEIAALDTKMRAVGRMTQTEFKNAVREVTGGASTRQLEGTFMTDEMAEGLVLDPALATILSIPAWSAVYEKMSGEKAEKHRAIWRNKVFHSKVPTTLDDFLNWLKQHNINIEPLRAAAGDAAIAAAAKQSTKSSRKRRGGHSDFYEDNDDSDNENPATGNPANFGDPVQNALRKAEKIKYAATGRAPYCTEILLAAADEYAAGLNPKRAPAEDAAAGAEARQVAPDQSGDKSPHSIPRAAAHCETGTRSSTASRPTDVPLRTMECGEFSPLSPSATCRAAAGAGTGSAA